MTDRGGILAFMFGVLASMLAGADTLFLEGGDRLSGTLLNISEGTPSFRVKLAGNVYVPLERVSGVNTVEEVALLLGEDRTLRGRMVFEEGETYLYLSGERVYGPVALGEVRGVSNLPEEEPTGGEVEQESSDSGVEVSVGRGYRWRTGTEDYSGLSLKLGLKAPTKSGTFETRINLEQSGEGGDDRDINRFFDAQARATAENGGDWNPELTLQLEGDRNKALKFRGEVLAGLGRDVLMDENQRLVGVAGIGMAFERYDAKALRRDADGLVPPLGGDDSATQREINLDLQLRYERRIFGTGTLREELVIRPSLSNLGDLRSRLESAVMVPIPLGLKLKMDLLLDYEKEPEFAGIDEWSTAFGASVHLEF